MQKQNNHLLSGSVVKSILMLAIPVTFANILQTVYQLIDTFWVGRLGVEAVAAVSLSFPILFFINSLAMGFVMAGSILVAQYNGKGDTKSTSLVAGQTLALVVLVALVISLVGYFASGAMLSFLTKDLSVLTQGTSYLRISFIAMPAIFIYIAFQSSLRGVGEVKLPMLIILSTVILNFFLDPLFMLGWKFIPAMGVTGVAIATLITEALSALIGIVILCGGRYKIKLKLQDLKLKMVWIKKIFKLGLPSSIEMSSRSFGMVLMIFVVSIFGTLTVAAYGIGTRLLGFVIMPAFGFAIATSSLVGNNLGAKQHDRAEKIVKTGIKISFWTLTVIGVIVFIFAKQISGFFVPNEPELITMSANFVKIMASIFGAIGIQMVIGGTLKSAGQTTVSMSLAIFHTILLFVLAYLLSVVFTLSEFGIWIAYPISNVVALLLAFYFYRRKDWLKKELV